MPESDVRLLTPKQAASKLAISERKLWDLTHVGDVPHIRIGRAVRYSVEDLADWIDSKRTNGSEKQITF